MTYCAFCQGEHKPHPYTPDEFEQKVRDYVYNDRNVRAARSLVAAMETLTVFAVFVGSLFVVFETNVNTDTEGWMVISTWAVLLVVCIITELAHEQQKKLAEPYWREYLARQEKRL